jgi:hypothetical protein
MLSYSDNAVARSRQPSLRDKTAVGVAAKILLLAG